MYTRDCTHTHTRAQTQVRKHMYVCTRAQADAQTRGHVQTRDGTHQAVGVWRGVARVQPQAQQPQRQPVRRLRPRRPLQHRHQPLRVEPLVARGRQRRRAQQRPAAQRRRRPPQPLQTPHRSLSLSLGPATPAREQGQTPTRSAIAAPRRAAPTCPPRPALPRGPARRLVAARSEQPIAARSVEGRGLALRVSPPCCLNAGVPSRGPPARAVTTARCSPPRGAQPRHPAGVSWPPLPLPDSPPWHVALSGAVGAGAHPGSPGRHRTRQHRAGGPACAAWCLRGWALLGPEPRLPLGPAAARRLCTPAQPSPAGRWGARPCTRPRARPARGRIPSLGCPGHAPPAGSRGRLKRGLCPGPSPVQGPAPCWPGPTQGWAAQARRWQDHPCTPCPATALRAGCSSREPGGRQGQACLAHPLGPGQARDPGPGLPDAQG